MEVTVRCGWTPFFLGPHPSFLQNEHSCQTTQLQLNYSRRVGRSPWAARGEGRPRRVLAGKQWEGRWT